MTSLFKKDVCRHIIKIKISTYNLLNNNEYYIIRKKYKHLQFS